MTTVFTIIGIIALGAIVYLIRAWPSFASADIAAKELFVCQECQTEFYPRWQEMVFGRWCLALRNEVKLRCPHCKKKQWCSEKRK